MSTVLIPGSFDPIHLGHVDVVDQAVELFGDVVVGVLVNFDKPSGIFTPSERVALIEATFAGRDEVRVQAFGGLTIDAARSVGAKIIVKGVRNSADFDIEQQMAHMNHSVAGVRTIFVPCRPNTGFVSSRFIREIASHGGAIDHLVPAPVADALAARFTPIPD
ncbi:MAG: pantetheine-phosphate adenylyltransferase [Ilumatobacter coccineus]|uniref:Phosphopantetheine adenylyltransferase n=1 Tax=Ilumatobacter coccineus TaxID=467094 RepID=A0A2G6KAX1_9ACTN|nr:MAG: pantetheine-phosphate adenylyltransferase [Ilumatobacter coccineus]